MPLHQKLGFPYLYFRFPCLSCIRVLLFPFRNPINPDTLSFGGISTSMWIWLGHPSASMVFTPFHLHHSRSISLFPPYVLRKIFFFCILAQTQYGICNSNSCVIIYFRRSSLNDLSLLFLCRCQTAPPIFNSSVYIIAISLLLNLSPSVWFSLYTIIGLQLVKRLQPFILMVYETIST